jgi:hypothetical protein
LLFKIAQTVLQTTAQIQALRGAEDQALLADYQQAINLLHEFAGQLELEAGHRRAVALSLQRMHLLIQEIASRQAEGFRLLDERKAFNMVLAGKAQRNRYQDMMTRVARNDALNKYQDAFDNAVRYAWLTAKAYDYETSLDPGDPAAATTFLESVIKTRQLGLWDDGEPQIGNGGLAEILAQLKLNYDALKGQLGINNPQLETGLLALRHEHFRIGTGHYSNKRWKQVLAGARVDDLWRVPEFRQYCRPFAARADGPQPGFVIAFSTQINPGRNVFGRTLGGADHASSTATWPPRPGFTWFQSAPMCCASPTVSHLKPEPGTWSSNGSPSPSSSMNRT